MGAIHILIFGEVVGFKTVLFTATHMKMKFFFHGAIELSELANLHENN